MIRLAAKKGFTLIELVAVIVIMGILATIAIKKLAPVAETMKIEETRQEMDELAAAIIGRPDLHNVGTRSDFGYVGDVGALPPNLDALKTNPGYGTWKGPYIGNDLEQIPDDFKKDAWQANYTYSGGVVITSTGSGSSISRQMAGAVGDLLYNTVSGNLLDRDGTPPGTAYMDSVTVQLTCPDGAGSTITKTAGVDVGGYFSFDSIPIGNHDLRIIYDPTDDTLRRFVSVGPNTDVYGQYLLPLDAWNGGTGGTGGGTGLEYVDNSDTLTSGNCFKLSFWITNNSGVSITVSSMTLSWGSPTAYYKTVTWGTTTVRSGNPALGSGDVATFSAPQTIDDGESVRIVAEQFHSDPGGGGSPVDMSGTTFTVEFSDGSTLTFQADLCT